MEREFDVAVIGSGSAGTNAAMALIKRACHVAVIDERSFGGTCALRGCDPKKVLVAAARAVNQATNYATLDIFDRAPKIDWSSLVRFKRTFTDPVPEKRLRTYEDAGIVAIHGQARFIDERSLRVGEERIRAKHIVVATGATELHIAAGDDQLLTSETFLELESLPESLLFIGGGYIAFEFAHVAARAGARVTVLNDNDTPLHGFDQDVVAHLLEATREAGIAVNLETTVESVERNSDGIVVHARTNDGQRRFQAREGVLAAGRVPDLEPLDLRAGGIERTEKGIKVNEYFQSVSNPNVYAAGDCADGGGLPLTPVAGYEGEIVATNILEGNARKPDFRGLVSMVYTIPSLAQAGMTEAKAREQKIDLEIRSGDMTEWFSTRHVAAQIAFYKTVLEKQSGRILGATILGPHAEEQVNVLALAIHHGLDGRATADTLFAYPTGSSDLEHLM